LSLAASGPARERLGLHTGPGSRPSVRHVSYLLRTYEIPRAEEDTFVARLWACGTLGVEVVETESGLRLKAWFERPFEEPTVLALARASEEWQAAEDWMAVYRAAATPIEVGARFLIDPREPGAAPVPTRGRILLCVPARTAFGTGSHESTRLVLERMEELEIGGRSILDVGCGSGILSLAARRLGAVRVVALDVDPAAALLAGPSARLNKVEVSCFAGTIAAMADIATFDLVLVNVLFDRIEPDIGAIVRRVRPGGEVVVSGFVDSQAKMVEERWGREGACAIARRQEGAWVALHLRVAGADRPPHTA